MARSYPSMSFVTAFLLLAVGCSSDSATTTEQATDSDPTVTSTTSVPAPTSTNSDPTVTFDGNACAYDGPTQVTGGGLTMVVLENTSDIDIDAVVFRVSSENSLQAAFDRLPAGSGSDIVLGAPAGSLLEAWLQASAGGRNAEQLVLEPGLYLIDCHRIPYGASAPDYVWRGGSFAVVAEE